MYFETLGQARAYAKSQNADFPGTNHKAIACRQWRFDRLSGYAIPVDCFTVILK